MNFIIFKVACKHLNLIFLTILGEHVTSKTIFAGKIVHSVVHLTWHPWNKLKIKTTLSLLTLV